MKRPLTAGEREQITRSRPWFGEGRRVANDDLECGEAEIFHFSVLRCWDVNECGPPCCPRALIIQTADNRFMYLASWTVLPISDRIGRNCIAHRAAVSRTLLTFETSGDSVSVAQESVRDALLDFAAAECEWVDVVDLPAQFRQIAALE